MKIVNLKIVYLTTYVRFTYHSTPQIARIDKQAPKSIQRKVQRLNFRKNHFSLLKDTILNCMDISNALSYKIHILSKAFHLNIS